MCQTVVEYVQQIQLQKQLQPHYGNEPPGCNHNYVYRYISNCNIYIIHIQFNGCYGNRTWYLLRIPLSTIASLNNEVAQMTCQLVRPLKTSSHATSATSINQAPAISIRATPRNVSAFHTSFYILSILRHVDSLPAGV